MLELLSQEVLQNIWFFIWGLLWAIYFILDGFDFGMGMLMPFIAKNDNERRIIYNSAGPFWDGNEVWLITAGGVTFAAFPLAYAAMFSALYAPLLILLFALIFRAVSFEYRNKIDSPRWRSIADACQIFGSFIPALLLGVAFANLFQGIPISTDYVYMGTIFSLLNLYGIAGGIFFILIFCVHGSIWLAIKSEEEIHHRAIAMAKKLWIPLVLVAVAFLGASINTPLYENYRDYPILIIIPALAVVMLLLLRNFLAKNQLFKSFAASSCFILFVTFFGVIGMYPSLIPSNIDPMHSITIAKAASTQITLLIMLVVSLICVPIVIGYQLWVFSVFSQKITKEELASKHSY